MPAKLTYENVKKYVESLGYELISKEYISISHKLILKDCEGYYLMSTVKDLKSGRVPLKFNKTNPYTIQNIELYCIINEKLVILISKEYINCSSHLTWKCNQNDCGEIFKMSWNNISNGFINKNCPYCAGKKAGLSNCLATRNPELAKEWHPTKNGDLTPYDVTCGSEKRVWWICEKGHEWDAIIYDRKAKVCPFCSNSRPHKDYNLLQSNPKLCEEWDYEKNKLSPENYLPFSHYKVWWKCTTCSVGWEARISDRQSNKSVGCNTCNNSRGEYQIRNFLFNWVIEFISQKKFKNLLGVGGGQLSYDFYLPDYNLLIEYQGEFHEKPLYDDHDFETQQEHDRRKREYAQVNNIKLLEIWYWDFDNIEDILVKELNLSKL